MSTDTAKLAGMKRLIVPLVALAFLAAPVPATAGWSDVDVINIFEQDDEAWEKPTSVERGGCKYTSPRRLICRFTFRWDNEQPRVVDHRVYVHQGSGTRCRHRYTYTRP